MFQMKHLKFMDFQLEFLKDKPKFHEIADELLNFIKN